MRNSDVIEKLNILGIYSSKQLNEKDLNYWWQLTYQENRDDQDYLYQINDILNELSDINIRELKSILDANNNSINEIVKNSSLNNNKSEFEDFANDHHLINVINYVENEDYDNAIAEATLGINFDENNAELYKLRALSRLDSKTIYKNDEIFNDIDKAIELDPTDAESFYIKARIIFDIISTTTELDLRYFTTEDLQKIKKAKNYLDIAIKLEQNYILAFLLRGRIKLFSEDIEGGRQDIYKVNELMPNNESLSDFIWELAYCTFQKYIGKDMQEYMEFFDEKSLSEIQQRNLLIIEKDLNLAIKLDKNNIPAYFYRGLVKRLQNNKEGSSRDFKIVNVKDKEDNLGYAKNIEEIEYMNNFFWKLNKWLVED